MSLFSISEIHPPKLKSEQKRQRLTIQSVAAYNEAIASSGILAPIGPLHLVDIHHLTRGERHSSIPICAARSLSRCMPMPIRLKRACFSLVNCKGDHELQRHSFPKR